MPRISSSRRGTTVDSSRLKIVIRCNILPLCNALYLDGKKTQRELRIGDVTGTPGDSLGIQLTGDKAGLWHDWATGEGGDFIDLVKAKLGVGFLDAVDWIQRTAGVSLQSTETVRGHPAKTCAHFPGACAGSVRYSTPAHGKRGTRASW